MNIERLAAVGDVPKILELKDVHTYYGSIHALKGISCALPVGKIACLIGANGAGKSTTLLTIFGIQKAASGQIWFNGTQIDNLEAEQVAAMGVSLAPEGRRIFSRMTVLENLEMGAYLRNDKTGMRENLEWIYNLFPVLRDRYHQLGGTLSGGEQQMLAIGRALMCSPILLLLDEPSLGLAPIIVDRIFETIVEINNRSMSIFLIEQNAHMALSISDIGYVMETGQIVLEDKASLLLRSDQIKKAYLGEN